MKKTTTFLSYSLIISLVIFTACTNVTLKDENKSDLKKTIEQRVPQDNEFAFKLFKQISETSNESNLFISPLSISIALGMAWNGAENETKSEMETTLQMKGLSTQEINDYYQYMQTTLPKMDPKTKLNIANSIWSRIGFPIKETFLQINQNYFDAEVRELDFSQSWAVDTINGWCARKTEDLIKKPLDRISEDAVMYLINAIYFKGMWTKPFHEKGTHEQSFSADNGSYLPVNMMNQKDTFNYFKDEYAQYIDLPYGDGSFSMTVLLPVYRKTTEDLLGHLTLETWNTILKEMKATEVGVGMPRFKGEYKYELNDILKSLGMEKAFIDGQANFSAITEAYQLFISRVIHNTFVEVNEKGTEAAAVTIIEGATSSMPEYEEFYASRPFLYIIREQNTGAILFMGRIGNPELY